MVRSGSFGGGSTTYAEDGGGGVRAAAHDGAATREKWRHSRLTGAEVTKDG
jgi:hypothetical protein